MHDLATGSEAVMLFDDYDSVQMMTYDEAVPQARARPRARAPTSLPRSRRFIVVGQ